MADEFQNHSYSSLINDALVINSLKPSRPWSEPSIVEQTVYETAYLAARALHQTVQLQENMLPLDAQIALQAIRLAEAEELAFTNPVTGLPNRHAFERELNARVAAQQDMAIAVIDVTNLKSVNDRYGHNVGDDVLRSTAVLIEASIVLDEKTRHQDFVAHLHGDEFAIIFDMEPHEDLSMSSAERIAAIANNFSNRMLDYARLSMPKDLGLDAAIGIVLHDPSTNVAETFNLADAAMYRHKQAQHLASGTSPR